MKMKLTALLLSGACFAGLPFSALLHAQAPRALDHARMQRDVEIMEMVLDRLMNGQSGRFMRLGTISARGTYIPNFGVLFQIPNNATVFSIAEMQERADRVFAEKKRRRVNEAAKPEAAQAELNEELWEFFSRYVDAIGQLNENDRIAVYSESGSEFSVFFTITGEETSQFTSQPGSFFAWMNKGDIAARRAGKLNEEEFRNRLHFVHTQEDNADIEIMSGILDKLTGARNGTAHGLYLEGYGVIFFAAADFAHDLTRQIWRERERVTTTTPQPVADAHRQIEAALREARSANEAREKIWQEGYMKFKSKVGEAFADYGHTLRSAKPEDWLVVTTDFHYAPEGQPQSLVCQIKKQRVDQYNAGKISREQLLKGVSYFEN